MTRMTLQTAYKQDSGYSSYIHCQIEKSFRLITESLTRLPILTRTIELVRLMKDHLPEGCEELRIVCIGCRDSRELDHIEKTCQAEVLGLDLFSVDPRIKVGDMHKMPFQDNQFDCLYACHSLEHSYDAEVALKEFIRVTKTGGLIVIEVPIQFQASDTDRWDVGSAENLVRCMGWSVDAVLVEHEEVRVVRGTQTKAARVVVRIKKKDQNQGAKECHAV